MEYRIIKTEKQYNEYCSRIMELAKKRQTRAVEEEIEILKLLLDKWEKENSEPIELDPIELLKYLMENRDLKQQDLVDILGITKGAVSQILSYKKGLSKEIIRKLAEYFKVKQEAFNRPYELVSDSNKGHKDEKMMNSIKDIEEEESFALGA